MSDQRFLIWWLSRIECGTVGGEAVEGWPPYLQKAVLEAQQEHASREHAPPRWVLWVDPRFGEVTLDPWPGTPLVEWTTWCVGIVVALEDLPRLEDLPGVVTNCKVVRFIDDWTPMTEHEIREAYDAEVKAQWQKAGGGEAFRQAAVVVARRAEDRARGRA